MIASECQATHSHGFSDVVRSRFSGHDGAQRWATGVLDVFCGVLCGWLADGDSKGIRIRFGSNRRTGTAAKQMGARRVRTV
jgi:hypothetical protein